MQYIKTRETVVWIAVLVLTILAWAFGPGNEQGSASLSVQPSEGLAAMVFALAFFKTRLVIMHFMEAGSAPWALRGALEAWVLIVFFLVVYFYLTGGAELLAPFIRE